MNKLSNDFIDLINDWFDSGTNSMNVSSMNTKLDLFSACLTIFNKFLLGIKTPVGLLGLHRNTIPFFGIFFYKFFKIVI